jgi:predicted nucleic acid-binding protein
VYFDSNALIYSVETHPTYWHLLEPVWLAAQQGTLTIVTSELAIVETLVGPLRSGDALLIGAYQDLYQSPDVLLLPISTGILRESARLRAQIASFRTPDAIHGATALASGCTMFLTNDRVFRQIPSIATTILDDLLIS